MTWARIDDAGEERIRAESIAKYRRRAGGYDRTCGPTWPIRERAVAALRLAPGMRVLDVGCGTGLSLALLREGVGDAGHVWVYFKNAAYNGAPGGLRRPWEVAAFR